MFVDIIGVDYILLFARIGGVEAYLFAHLFHDGIQAAGPYVLLRLVQLEGLLGHGFHAVGGKLQRHTFGGHKGDLLRRKRIAGFGQNPLELVLIQVLQLHANGKTPLQLRHQIARFTPGESSGGHKENVVGMHQPVPRVYGRAFDDGQQITLHTLA